MKQDRFTPYHINATPDDLAGNNGIGRYILLPGSGGRAHQIAQHFDNQVLNAHPRGHNLYLGTISHQGQNIDVATVPSGMGCPSMEIILHELFHLGGKRFLRVGTSGSLQNNIKIGDIINVQASVRDEQTTTDYAPLAIPAIASVDMISAITLAAKQLDITNLLHTGIVHCKSSFYAREFGEGPQSESNQAYMNLLTQCGVLATEMETATLFIQSQLYNHQLHQAGNGLAFRVLCGAILAIVSEPPTRFASAPQEKDITKNLIDLSLEAIKCLYVLEKEKIKA